MCGRYVFNPDKNFNERFDVDNGIDLKPNYNVSPGQFQPVITQNNGQILVSEMKWGLIPFWSKDPKIGFRMINARADTVYEKPSFKKAFKSQRCLIPANGFFEWKTTGRSKLPFYYYLKNEPLFAFAGIYDSWRSPDGGEISTYTIITTDANDLVKKVHDRMPVILPQTAEKAWLDFSVPEPDLLSFLNPYSVESMAVYQVSTRLNRSSENDPSLINPLT
jgi:putative SOS response-associated peptidase YedK